MGVYRAYNSAQLRETAHYAGSHQQTHTDLTSALHWGEGDTQHSNWHLKAERHTHKERHTNLLSEPAVEEDDELTAGS